MTAGQKPHDGSDADWVPMTIRLPSDMHKRLRYEAFFGNTSMSAIVREGIEMRIADSPEAHVVPEKTPEVNQPAGPGPD